MLNLCEFALAVLCVLESSMSNRERALSSLEHKSSEQTSPAAILWPSAGGIWESCSVHVVLNDRYVANIVSEFTSWWHAAGTLCQALITCFLFFCARFTEALSQNMGVVSTWVSSSVTMMCLYHSVYFYCLHMWPDRESFDLKGP